MDPWLLWLIAAGLFAAGEIVSLDLVLLFLFIAAYRKTPAVDSSRS